MCSKVNVFVCFTGWFCLDDLLTTPHPQPLPELSRIPGLVLSGKAFAHCLAVVEFLHGYGKVIGLNVAMDVPSLATLQEGLLGLGDCQGEVQDLVIKLMEAALHDPGLPSFYQVCERPFTPFTSFRRMKTFFNLSTCSFSQ